MEVKVLSKYKPMKNPDGSLFTECGTIKPKKKFKSYLRTCKRCDKDFKGFSRNCNICAMCNKNYDRLKVERTNGRHYGVCI